MKVKRVLVSLMAILIFIATFSIQGISYAANGGSMYLGITEKMTRNEPNMGYSIGNPGANSSVAVAAKIWNIQEYTGDGDNALLKADGAKNIFCVKAGVGFSDTKRRAAYDLFYNMKTERETIKSQNEVLASIVNGTIPYGEEDVGKYNALLAAIDMLYLPGDSSLDDKEQLMSSVASYASQKGYSNFIPLMESYPLTDDDIVAVEQAILWYFTNYYKQDTGADEYTETEEHNMLYDKTNDTNWLCYILDGTSYDNLVNYAPNGELSTESPGYARNYQAEVLYNYIIDKAKANANKYSSTSTSTGTPAILTTTELSGEESGDNYIIGPIYIKETEGNTIPYTIDFEVKNEGSQISNYTLLNVNKEQVTSGTTVKDLVGRNFYLLIPKTSVTNLSVDVTINYKDTKMTLWASSTNNQEQPVVIPEKENRNVKKTISFSPEAPKPFDLALRKYITQVNGENVVNTRVPNIDESTIASETTTATYKHRKDPVLVETGDVVTYKLTIYNEGEKAGRATKIVDQLPTGLKFKRVVSGNFELDSYNKDTDNTLKLKRKQENTTNLPAYTSGSLTSGTGTETIEIECTVTARPDTENNTILTNVAWISEAYNSEDNTTYYGNEIGHDRDSAPGTHPDVNKDNMSNYTGNSNKKDLSDKGYYYKGQQDDDDFEKLVLLPKRFDLALRKYITQVNGENVVNTRIPNIEESTIASETTTATYKHRKDPVLVETGDVVTYKLTIYNEGDIAGRATKIVDQLPTGLKFSRVVSGNFELDSYNKDTDNTLKLKRKQENTTNLPAYTSGSLTSGTGTETIEIECTVVATPDSQNRKILTNVAWISEEIDEDGTTIVSQIGKDRDSEPGSHPNVNKDNMSNYIGNSENSNLSPESPSAYFKGEQDDDDFEKLVLEPQVFDLKLIKNITAVNATPVTERLKQPIDVSKLNIATNPDTTATYKMDKNPVSVAKGDIVTYRLRVYNEGTIDGYAKEITEDIPEGLEFIFVSEGQEASAEEKAASDFNMENGWAYADSTMKTIKTTKLALHPLINGEPDSLAHTDNLIRAFGKNDGTKTENDLEFKDVYVKMKVVSENLTGIIIRNEAAITDDSDKDGNEITDRDSTPEEWKKENSSKYYDDENKWPTYREDDEDYDNIILKPFDLALRKFIIAVSDDENIDNDEYLKDNNGQYTRAPQVDTSKLNTLDDNGKMITTAIYNHTKEPVKVKKNDIVVYMLRVYNEGEIDGYAAEIKDHLPEYLEFVDGQYNRQYGWTVSEDGRTVTTTYLANQKINAATLSPRIGGITADGLVEGLQPYILSFKEVPIMCKVKDTAKVNEKITNIADITKYLDEDKKPVNDRDSSEDNVSIPEDKDLPKYKDDEHGDYIPGQEDDDDFEKVIIPRFDLALRKQIVTIHNNYKNQDKAYNDRFANLDNSKNNTIYNYYDVESNIPTVVENDVVTYSIRVYNEGEVDGTATWVTDRLPSGLDYLPDSELNKNYGWKAYKQSTKDSENAIKIGEKYYEEVGFDSKEIYMYATEYLKDSVIKAYNGTGEANYKEVYMAARVKAKNEVAEGTEYKLRNIAEIGEDDNDDDDSTPGDESKWQDQDDVDIEDLKLVEFDLALRKWVTEAIVIENGKTTVTATGHQPYDDPEQVVKVDLHRKKLNQVTVKFRYSIRVINEGDIPGYAKEVTDYIPQGLKFVAEDNEGWTDEGDNVISTKLLENTLLNPGEYADVEVVLTWINSQDNMGVMVNTAEISQDENDYGVPDRDSVPDNKKPGEDDIDDAPVMLAIETGQARIYFVLGFIILTTVAGGVVLIKKFVL